ncbi:hypothetical protein [Exiguobacterium sp. s146]|uniref:hypothetical protein n=1 Tax=Exiguobacterium sp. s146 TaxID=2751223 RepID=UPI001BEBB637|nr:hypothetical protein [Exiguobacterium sp. s146]
MAIKDTEVKWNKKMNLKLKVSDENIVNLGEGAFFQEDSSIVFKEMNPIEYTYKIKHLLNVDKIHNENDYMVFTFYNNSFAENDIYQVYDHASSTRIGWTFPLQSLLSNNHDYAHNEHFLPYALVAFKKLIIEEFPNSLIPEVTLDGEYNLGDFYNADETIIMVLNKNQTRDIENFSIINYLPFLYGKGYYADNYNYKSPISCNGKRLNLKVTSEEIRNDEFIIQLFQKLLLQDNHHLVRFYLLYQVIELLIEKVFKKEFSEMLDSLGTDEKTLFQIKEDLGNIAKEKKRINKLFTVYTRKQDIKIRLMESCNEILRSIGRKQFTDPSEALYNVRNLFVHEYRSIPMENHYMIESINDLFEELVIEMTNDLRNLK